MILTKEQFNKLPFCEQDDFRIYKKLLGDEKIFIYYNYKTGDSVRFKDGELY